MHDNGNDNTESFQASTWKHHNWVAHYLRHHVFCLDRGDAPLHGRTFKAYLNLVSGLFSIRTCGIIS